MDAALADRIAGKVARRIIPLLAVLYLISYLDRVNVGFAALTMNQDLGLSATLYGWGAGIFFFGYLLFQAPSNLLLQRVGARRWIAVLLLAWGVVSVATGWIQGPTSFLAARFLLGVTEAGFFPGVILYLTYWVGPAHRGRIIAAFMFAIPVSNIVGAPLSSLILTHVHGGGLAGWRWLFILEGAPALAGALAVLALLPDGPRSAAWLTDAEKQALAQTAATPAEVAAGRGLVALIAAPEVWLFCAVYFGITLATYGLGLWLPQMIKAAGVSTGNSALYAAAPYACGAAGMLAWSWIVDSRGAGRASSVWTPILLSAIGVAASAFTPWPWQLAAFSVATVGTVAAASSFWTLPTHRFGVAETAVAVALINSAGNLGGFVGPIMIGWIKDATHSFSAGLLFVALCVAASGALLALFGRAPVADMATEPARN